MEKFDDDQRKDVGLLQENGLFEKEATAILDAYTKGPLGGPMSERMDDGVEGYAAPILSVTWLGVKKTAVEWIDANCPQHWARGMFV